MIGFIRVSVPCETNVDGTAEIQVAWLRRGCSAIPIHDARSCVEFMNRYCGNPVPKSMLYSPSSGRRRI